MAGQLLMSGYSEVAWIVSDAREGSRRIVHCPLGQVLSLLVCEMLSEAIGDGCSEGSF